MKKIFYEKVGRKYVPIAEYDSDYLDSFPKGNHLVMCYPGGKSRRFNIDPNYAALIAAGRVAQESMTRVIQEASEIRREDNAQTPMTTEQRDAWEHLIEVFGERARYLRWPSAHDVADAGIRAMQEEANKLMQHETVRAAYEQFLLVCELTKENDSVQS